MTFKNIALQIAYDGTNFSGYQIQKNKRSVQEEVEKAIKKVTNENIRTFCAGRTDAGVHAKCQVINFLTNTKIKASKFYFHLQKFLPDDIKAISSREVSLYFHSRFSAKNKEYHYVINTQKNMHPIYRNYMENVTYNLNFELLNEGLNILKGKHDFKAFMLNEKDVIINTERILKDCKFERKKNKIILEFVAESFLHNQVRIMSGSLISLSRGQISLDEFKSYLTNPNKKAGPTLKAGGLYLERINY